MPRAIPARFPREKRLMRKASSFFSRQTAFGEALRCMPGRRCQQKPRRRVLLRCPMGRRGDVSREVIGDRRSRSEAMPAWCSCGGGPVGDSTAVRRSCSGSRRTAPASCPESGDPDTAAVSRSLVQRPRCWIPGWSAASEARRRGGLSTTVRLPEDQAGSGDPNQAPRLRCSFTEASQRRVSEGPQAT
jgi:hypothetical protein